jgi:hypothetical protein
MKLGIVVVYLVSEGMRPLLDLHLRKIDENTSCPYTIYGTALRLPPVHEQVLERNPRVRLVSGPTPYEDRDPDQSSGSENAYYLDRLVDAALTDGVTHLCTLHVDSFPVRKDWVEYLLGQIDDTAPLAAVLRRENGDTLLPMPCCLFTTREFQASARPRFMISRELEESEAFRAFSSDGRDAERDTGFGYAFALHRNGLQWHRMLRSNDHDDHYLLAGIYDDVVFHLGAAARYFVGWPLHFRGAERGSGRTPEFLAARDETGRQRVLEEEASAARPKFEQIYEALLEDPDTYIDRLRARPSYFR